jgi:hypothetical protein
MVSGRRAKAERRATSTAGTVEHVEVTYYPKYYWLFEHDTRHTVIRVPGPQDMLEIDEMMRRGNALCNHPDRLGACIHLESATFDEWLETHPGE